MIFNLQPSFSFYDRMHLCVHKQIHLLCRQQAIFATCRQCWFICNSDSHHKIIWERSQHFFVTSLSIPLSSTLILFEMENAAKKYVFFVIFIAIVLIIIIAISMVIIVSLLFVLFSRHSYHLLLLATDPPSTVPTSSFTAVVLVIITILIIFIIIIVTIVILTA